MKSKSLFAICLSLTLLSACQMDEQERAACFDRKVLEYSTKNYEDSDLVIADILQIGSDCEMTDGELTRAILQKRKQMSQQARTEPAPTPQSYDTCKNAHDSAGTSHYLKLPMTSELAAGLTSESICRVRGTQDHQLVVLNGKGILQSDISSVNLAAQIIREAVQAGLCRKEIGSCRQVIKNGCRIELNGSYLYAWPLYSDYEYNYEIKKYQDLGICN